MKSQVCMAVILFAAITLEAGCDRSSSDPKPAVVVLEREAPVVRPVEKALSGRPSLEGLNPLLVQSLTDQEARLRELPDLLRRAEQGDMQAAAVLGKRLVTCVDHSDAMALKQRFEQELAEAKERAQGDSLQEATFTSNARYQYASGLIEHEACSALGDAQIANYHLWLEKAARAGVASAKSAYVSSALNQFEDKGALIANIEEAARRRGIARAWMEEILQEKGNPDREDRLRQYVSELHGQGSRLFAADEQKGITYQYVLDMVIALRMETDPRALELTQRIAQLRGEAAVGPATPSRFAQLWTNGPDRYGHVSDERWKQAVDEGRYIFTRDFGPAPK